MFYRSRIIIFFVLIFLMMPVFSHSLKSVFAVGSSAAAEEPTVEYSVYNGEYAQQLFINEIMSSNGSTIADEDGNYEDWLELYNSGDAVIDLTGYYLSDNDNNKLKWQFPQSQINPGDFLLIWTSGNDKVGINGELHTSFSISADGEPLILTAPDTVTIVDQIPPIPIPRDESYGRNPDGSNNWYFYKNNTSTPDSSNIYIQEYLDSPLFSHSSGFYENEFYLELSTNDPEAIIYYTLDGSDPQPANDNPAKYYIKQDYTGDELIEREKVTYEYTEPILIQNKPLEVNNITGIKTTHSQAESQYEWKEPITTLDKAVVIKAIAYKEGAIPSKCITNTYFVDENIFETFSLPVVSLIMDPADLFDYEDGIYVPGKLFTGEGSYDSWKEMPANYWEDWEKPASIALFEPDGTVGFMQNIGIRIHGGWTRAQPLKSLRVYARSEYDTRNVIQYEIFPAAVKNGSNEKLDEFKRLILRNGGQSFYSTMLEDGIMQKAFLGNGNVDLQNFRPALHFINGEYWGIINIQERLDKYYLHYHYNVDPDNLAIIEGPYAYPIDMEEGDESDRISYINMRDYGINNDLSLEENFNYIKSLIDIESFIDYNVLRIYSGDIDSIIKHMYTWREKIENVSSGEPVTDGRWRWQTWDFDLSLNYYNVGQDLLSMSIDPESEEATVLLRNLLKNDDFKQEFLNRFADHINTTFAPVRMEKIIEETSSAILPEVERHIERWGYPVSLNNWLTKVESFKDWSNERPMIQRQQLVEQFNLGGTVNLNLTSNTSEGIIKVNTIEIDENMPGIENPGNWTGIYFQGVPIHLQAIPKHGYRFVRWEGNDDIIEEGEEDCIFLELENDVTIQALFEVDEEDIVVNIPDSNLRAGIEDILNKQAGEPIYQSDLAMLEILDLRDKGISNIEGFQYFTNLKELDLSLNEITNIDALSALTSLVELNLRENDITDISPLSSLINLQYLNLHTNPNIETITPLENLTALRELIMRNVPIEAEITVLSGLTNLFRLNIRNTGITNVQVLGQLMAAGALQDNPILNIEAEIDIRDNDIAVYNPIRPYWDNISVKDPETLPEGTGQDECFIATAAFGTKFSPAVMLLRQFRDKYLLTNSPGRFFVEYYYKTSPPIAYFIAKNTILKKVVQVALIPAVIVAYLLMNPLISILLLMCIMFIYSMYHKRKGLTG